MAISTIAELLNLFPANVIQYSGHEYKGPCPFCESGSKTTTLTRSGKTVAFYGEDRLVIDDKGLFCRKCHSQSRGYGSSTNGWYPHRAIAELFNTEISDDLEMSDDFEEEELETWTLKQVVEANNNVVPEYWKQFYWDDDTIHRFRLGYGKLSTYPRPGHVVPMRVHHVEDDSMPSGYYMHLRSEDGEKRRLHGSSRNYVWLVNWELGYETALIVEGEKDGITASVLGYKNVVPLYGATTWNDTKTKYLIRRGIKNVIVIMDADDAGKDATSKIVGSARRHGLHTKHIEWVKPPKEVKDLTDLFVHHEGSKHKTIEYLDANFILLDALAEESFNLVEHVAKEVTLDIIRGDNEDGLKFNIQQFLTDYDEMTNRRKGLGLMLRTGPGAGKTHRMIQQAQEIARNRVESKREEYQGLLDNIGKQKANLKGSSDEIQRAMIQQEVEYLQQQIDDFSFQSVAWFGMYKDGWRNLMSTGADQELWYNYEARNETNCENIKKVGTLSSKKHNVGKFCRTMCPFRESCFKDGYMSQDEKAKKKPITFFRHDHLKSGLVNDYNDLVVVDEYPGKVLEDNPIRFTAKDVRPHHDLQDRMEYDTERDWNLISQLASAMRNVMTTHEETEDRYISDKDGNSTMDENPEWCITGSAVLRRIDNQLKAISNISLTELMENLDREVVHNVYQPDFTPDTDNIMLRCVPQFYDAVRRELPAYVRNHMNEFPSCIHLEGGVFEVYEAHPVRVNNYTPIVVADATGIPDIYRALFRREFQLYNPRFRNPNAHTQVINKSDWTRASIKKHVGPQMIARKEAEKRRGKEIINLEGEVVDVEKGIKDVWNEIYDSGFIQDLLNTVRFLSDQHKTLLVVTHKPLKELLEGIAVGNKDGYKFTPQRTKKVAWAHYGSLRGTNEYEDYEAVLLIGAFRIPYQAVWKRLQMWAWMLGIVDPIPFEIVSKKAKYDSTDIEGRYYTIDHPFAENYIDMVERGEMIQSSERTRPHASNNKKAVYVMAERPALNFVSEIISKTEFLRQFKEDNHTKAMKFMNEYWLQNNKYPTYSTVQDKFGVSSKTVSKLVKQLKEKQKDELAKL